MHAIERLFGIAPDGGNGSLELTMFALLLVLTFLVLRSRKRTKKSSAPPLNI